MKRGEEMRVGVPRVLSYFYYLPFYKKFLESLDCEMVLSSHTNGATLEKLDACPTDEPCISVKLAFPHAQELVEMKVDYLFIPTLVSGDNSSFYCPKHIGLPAMLRNGLDLTDEFIMTPRIDWRSSPRESIDEICLVGSRLGAGETETRRALYDAWIFQNRFNRLAVERKLTFPEALEQAAGLARFKRKSPYNPAAQRNAGLRVGVVGHSYILYDFIGHNIVERLREHATVLVPEMVPHREASSLLSQAGYGKELWTFEQIIVGSALYWLRRREVDCLILFGPFECGPEAVIEVFIEEEAEREDVPLLILTVDEQTAEAGLVTRLEAFLDTASSRKGNKVPAAVTGRLPGNSKENEPCEKERFIAPPFPDKRVLGFPTLGKLGGALATIFNGELASAVGPIPITRKTTELGAQLAPEFICYPLTVTIGQMRQCLEAGANTLVMVGGKGRCRLGWYAEMQEILLKRAGYDFEMLVINSPVPLARNWRPFIEVMRKFFEMRLGGRVLFCVLLALYKAALTEKAEEQLYRLRAREIRRGEAERVYRRFLDEARDAGAFASLFKSYRRFGERCRSIELSEQAPYRVRLIGEIYAVFEDYVNHEIARSLGSLKDIRIEVEREITVINWFRQNILHSPSATRRHRQIIDAARPYLDDMVGGHGLDSIGLAALAPRERVDGLVHLWPFTCMPEIIAQSILTRVVRELDLPLLTVIINEQSGEAGLQTRIESFAHILRERNLEKEVPVR